MKNLTIIAICVLIFAGSCKTKKLTLFNPQSTVESSIDNCINLLEEKKYEELLSKYIYPDVKEEILKEQTIEKLANSFAKSKAKRLLKAMNVAKDKKVEYKKNGTVATIDLGSEVKGVKKIEFMKKEGLWYIAD